MTLRQVLIIGTLGGQVNIPVFGTSYNSGQILRIPATTVNISFSLQVRACLSFVCLCVCVCLFVCLFVWVYLRLCLRTTCMCTCACACARAHVREFGCFCLFVCFLFFFYCSCEFYTLIMFISRYVSCRNIYRNIFLTSSLFLRNFFFLFPSLLQSILAI